MPGGNFYKPVLYMNEFWNMQRDYFPLNETVEELELFITYQPLSLFKWQLYAAQSMKNQWASSLLGIDSFFVLFFQTIIISWNLNK